MSIEERAEKYLETKFSYGDVITMTEYSKQDIAKKAYIAGYNDAQNTITQCNKSALSGIVWHDTRHPQSEKDFPPKKELG